MKTIDFNRNWKLINLDTNKDKGYFDLDCGKFGVMFFEFDIDFNVDSDFEFESVDVKLSTYDWDCDGLKSGMLNNRNTKLICEKLEERISSNPESWGFDSEQLRYEAQLDFETEREIAYFNERC
jgi:hypothetical protein